MTKRQEIDELEAKAARADSLYETVSALADRDLAALPPQFQAYIRQTAGDDPEARLRAINAARSSGVLDLVPRTPPPAAAAAGVSAPVEAAPPAPAPEVLKPPTRYEEWQALKRDGKTILAAQFFVMHKNGIESSRPGSSAPVTPTANPKAISPDVAALARTTYRELKAKGQTILAANFANAHYAELAAAELLGPYEAPPKTEPVAPRSAFDAVETHKQQTRALMEQAEVRHQAAIAEKGYGR